MWKKLLVLLVAVCASTGAFAASADSLTLALNWKAEPQFGGFYAAQYEGFFGAQQLQVDIVEGGSGTPTVQMLAAGKVDYAIVSADEIVIAHDRGADNVVAIFASFQTNPQAIMTHAERGFASLADVMGTDGTLLWQVGLPYAQFFKKKYAPIKVTTAPYIGGIAAFQNNRNISQQCFVTSEPLHAKKAGLKVKTFLVADSGYNPYTTVLATTRERLQNHPEEVQRMVVAVREGWNKYLKSPESTNRKMGALNKSMDAQTFSDSAQAQIQLIMSPDIAHTGEMKAQRWEQLSGQLLDIGVIKKAADASRFYVNL